MNTKIKKKLVSYAVNMALVLALFAILTVLIDSGAINRYYAGLIKLIFINIMLAVSLNLVTGILGQLVLGHAGFMSVGAYTAALFTLHSGLPTSGPAAILTLLLAIAVGGVVSAAIGFLIGVPALRLKGTTSPSSPWALARSSASSF